MTRLFALALLIPTAALCDIQSVPAKCALAQWFGFEEIIFSVIETTPRQVPVINTGDPQVIVWQCFASAEACNTFRASLNAFGVSVPLGPDRKSTRTNS